MAKPKRGSSQLKKSSARGHKRRRSGSRTEAAISRRELELAASVFGGDAADRTLDASPTGPSTSTSGGLQADIDGAPVSGAEVGAGAGAGAGAGGAEGAERAAWSDSDDEEVKVDVAAVPRLRKLRRLEGETTLTGREYSNRLREQFKKSSGGATWADVPADASPSGSTALVSSAAATGGLSERLPTQRIDMKRLKDANAGGVSKSVVQSVDFHPTGQVMLSAGFDKRLRLFQVDGVTNSCLSSVFFPDMPIRTARFSADGKQAICSGRRPFWYSFDVESGKATKVDRIIGRTERSLERFAISPTEPLVAFFGNHGYLMLVSTVSKHWVATLKMNGSVRAAAFGATGTDLYAVGGDGEVYRWDLRTRRPLARHTDEGSSACSAIAVAPDNRSYAVGSESGVVNLYETEAMSASTSSASPFGRSTSAHAPVKSFMHMTTAVDDLVFNHDSQILAASSRRGKDSMKLIHCSTRTVFANWPTSKTPLHYVTSLAFSPHSGYLSVGNDRGRALLYRLKHYSTA